MEYIVIAYIVIGIIECIYDWHKELKYEYKAMIEDGEIPDDSNLILYWCFVIALWPVLVMLKAYRNWK